MATTMTARKAAELFIGYPDARMLLRQSGRVLSAWSLEISDDGEPDDGVVATGETVFGGPPAPDMGDDIATWYLTGEVEVIAPYELDVMRMEKEADEAARPVYELGEQGQLVVAPDGSTILAAEDAPRPPSRRSAAEVNRLIDAGMDRYAERQAVLDAPVPTELDRQLAMRRRTLATFCRDYAESFEQGDEDMLPILEGTLQLVLRRVMEVTDP